MNMKLLLASTSMVVFMESTFAEDTFSNVSPEARPVAASTIQEGSSAEATALEAETAPQEASESATASDKALDVSVSETGDDNNEALIREQEEQDRLAAELAAAALESAYLEATNSSSAEEKLARISAFLDRGEASYAQRLLDLCLAEIKEAKDFLGGYRYIALIEQRGSAEDKEGLAVLLLEKLQESTGYESTIYYARALSRLKKEGCSEAVLALIHLAEQNAQLPVSSYSFERWDELFAELFGRASPEQLDLLLNVALENVKSSTIRSIAWEGVVKTIYNNGSGSVRENLLQHLRENTMSSVVRMLKAQDPKSNFFSRNLLWWI
jgi:hypothetical protein